jgi:hypothetical protein
MAASDSSETREFVWKVTHTAAKRRTHQRRNMRRTGASEARNPTERALSSATANARSAGIGVKGQRFLPADVSLSLGHVTFCLGQVL